VVEGTGHWRVQTEGLVRTSPDTAQHRDMLVVNPEPADEAMRVYLETFHGRTHDTGKKKCGSHDTERKKIVLNNNT